MQQQLWFFPARQLLNLPGRQPIAGATPDLDFRHFWSESEPSSQQLELSTHLVTVEDVMTILLRRTPPLVTNLELFVHNWIYLEKKSCFNLFSMSKRAIIADSQKRKYLKHRILYLTERKMCPPILIILKCLSRIFRQFYK